jgi:prevent-host-death family protein
MAQKSTVGARELRQNLSVYLRKIRHGERCEVTDRGKAVALLMPLPEAATPLARLVAEGRVTPPSAALSELGPPVGERSRPRPVTRSSEPGAADPARRHTRSPGE